MKTLEEAVKETMMKKWKINGLSDAQYQKFADRIEKKFGYTQEEIFNE